MKRLSILSVGCIAAVGLAMGMTGAVATAPVVVTPTNTQGWSTADTRPGGAVDFVVDSSAPAGVGALQLTTDATTSAKAQYLHAANTPLSNVTEAAYDTKQVAPAGPIADPSYQLITYLNGGTSGFTTLVFEPYQNTTEATVANDTWQHWNVADGMFWSTRTVTCTDTGTTITGSPGGPAVYTLAEIQSSCPSAIVAGFGVNIGSNNPSYTVETDLVNFNGTVYDFEPYAVAHIRDDCKDGGFANVRTAGGDSFRNQGDCIQYVNNGK